MSLPKFYSVESYIDYFSEHSELLETLRYLIRNSNPKISERIRYNCPFYDYYGMFLFLAVQKKRVVIGFVDGVLMSNEANAFIPLKGTQIRHLQYATSSDVNEEILFQYLQEAMMIKELRQQNVR